MSIITDPTPIPDNTNFSVYYTYSTLPDIQPPGTTYQLTKQGVPATVYSLFNANTSITTQSLNEPYFLTRDSGDNIYFTTRGYLTSNPGTIQVYLLNKNGNSSTVPTVAISQTTGGFTLLSGISIGASDNELWVADSVSGQGVLKKFTKSSGTWSLTTTYTPNNSGTFLDPPTYILGIKYRSGVIYACNNDTVVTANSAIYSINVTGSTSPAFSTYTSTNTDSPYDLTFDNTGNLYYVNNSTGGYGSLVKFDGTTSILVSPTYIQGLNAADSGIFLDPAGLAFNNDFTRLYITGSSSNSIMYYTIGITENLTTFITDNVPGGSGGSGLFYPYGIIFDSKKNIYVANLNNGYPTVLNGYIQKIQGIQYNFINISGLPPGSYPVNVYDATQAEVVTGTTFSISVQCYLKGTKILTYIDEKEVWVNIENLKPSDLVKTYKNGFIRVKNIGWSQMQNSIHLNPNKLFKIEKNKLPELTEDLYVSGKHSRLVDELTQEQISSTLKIWSKLQQINDKYLLMACVDDLFTDVKDENIYDMYQIILQSDSASQQYGIYANGLLSESMSIQTFERKKQMKPFNMLN